MERLQKILSAHAIASRREAEKMISAGKVTVNGVIATLGSRANPDTDEIFVDGKPLTAPAAHIYIMLNKPRGYITTASDDRGRKTVMSLISEVGTRVYPVGRLDMESEGLLLLTNDGEFANKIAHPSFNKTKTYEVSVRGDLEGKLAMLRRPLEIDSHVVCAKSVSIIRKQQNGGVFAISISEGRNRQVRKMCAICGLEVLSLTRVSIGSLELGELSTGKWRYLTDAEIKSLSQK